MISFLSLALASTASAACTRSFLQEIAAAYIKSQIAGTPSSLPLGSPLNYIENDIPLNITSGVLSKGFPIDFHRSVYDTVTCSTYTELNAASAPHPYVIHTIIRTTNDKITTIDSVVSDDGDWIFDAKGHLSWALQEKWDPIPLEKQDKREVIQAAGDTYLDQWGNSTLPVPLGTPCARLEGGMYTGNRNATANTCRMPAFPQPLKVGNRRYVIDVEMGTVGILNDFPWLEASKGANGTTPSSNMFYVVEGMVRYIHEVTVCATRMCGR
ncbi:hypothetical protein QBC34DRAFT_296294 [Podospora aff. communis PSN243]|uniref:DUF8021 domain-containing protein n=1 Tax=Podospora aff. communis PSN243 TaxID=3040156 RepID=A0AAV9GTY7_9PEZI|nr:hypothetical protein QBC34DRAFT_296294 [Podospora aff. communis PSN243]